jgi:hypothetical protein
MPDYNLVKKIIFGNVLMLGTGEKEGGERGNLARRGPRQGGVSFSCL